MYKLMTIKAEYSDNYKKRVYIINQEEFDILKMYNTFVIRESLNCSNKIYKSVEDGRHYIIK